MSEAQALKAGETKEKNVDVLHADRDSPNKQIVLPHAMDYKEGIKWLQRKDEEQSRKVSINEQVNAYPLDGALALHKAMARKYGWNHLIPTPGFFGDRPPAMIGIRTGTGIGDVVQVPWGRIEIPGVNGYIETQITISDKQPKFVIGGVVMRKHEAEVAELAKLAREIVQAESVYRGKAVRIKFFEDPKQVEDIADFNPKFIDVQSVREEELIFPKDIHALVRTNLFTPIEKTAVCRKHKIPLKRGILLAGPYGVGKTLTANVAAKKCVENGWTFVYLESVRDLQQAIHFAKQYSPAMIFAEDIDQVVRSDQRRDEEINGILNTIDGVDTKSSEIIVALTTNHVENISKAMLRPGRLDAVINVPAPDAEAAQRLVRLYARTLLDAKENLDQVGVALANRIPAVIREVVERAKLAAISHTEEEDKLRITADDLLIAAHGMTQHLELLKPVQEDLRSDAEKAAEVQSKGYMAAAQHIAAAAFGKTAPNGTASQHAHA